MEVIGGERDGQHRAGLREIVPYWDIGAISQSKDLRIDDMGYLIMGGTRKKKRGPRSPFGVH